MNDPQHKKTFFKAVALNIQDQWKKIGGPPYTVLNILRLFQSYKWVKINLVGCFLILF